MLDQIAPADDRTGPLFELASAGYDLIPLHSFDALDRRGRTIGKAPLGRNWTFEPAMDAAEAADHLRGGFNVGVRLRPLDLVVDYDPRNDHARDALDRLAADYGLALSPSVLTGGGGRHVYLRLPEPRRLFESLEGYPGVEFKGLGRQVVAPGSIHPNGTPYVLEGAFAAQQAPSALLEGLAKPEVAERPGAGSIGPERLARLLSVLDAKDYRDQGKWLSLMMACHYETAGNGRDEFIEWSTSDDAFADHAWIIGRRWDSLHTEREGEMVTGATLYAAVWASKRVDDGPGDVQGAIDDFADVEDAVVEAAPPRRATVVRDADGNLLSVGRFFTLQGMMTNPKPTYLVEGLVRRGGVNSIVGPSGSWKTYLATTLALFASNGRRVPGWDLETQECLVLYVTPETPDDFPSKVFALTDAHPGLSPSRFLISPQPLSLTQPPEADRFLREVADVRAETGWTRHVLLVVDTFHANWADGDSNSADDVQKFINALLRVCQKADATALFVHHTGKDRGKGAMGSSAFYNGVDVQLVVHPSANALEVETAKVKGIRKQPRGTYRARVRDVASAVNPYGTELVLEPVAAGRQVDDGFPPDEPAPAQPDGPTLDDALAEAAERARAGDDYTAMLAAICAAFPEADGRGKQSGDARLKLLLAKRGLVTEVRGKPTRRFLVEAG